MKRKLVIAFIGVLAIVVLFGLANSWFTPAFKGGELTKGSLFSYPRYHGRLPALNLGHNAQYSATFSGFPVRDASIVLDLPDYPLQHSQQIASMESTVTLRVENSEAKIVCSASGRLSEINNVEHHWVLSVSDAFARLWNSDCTDFKLDPRETYVVTVIVTGADGKTALSARPLLLGGGIELP